MNEIARPQITADQVNPISMMFDPIIADRVMVIAQTMSKGGITVPEYLHNNIADCLAIVMQAASWQLNPFMVAQKARPIHGVISYEAQLVSAIVSSLKILDGRFSYEYIGDWNKIAKRPKIQTGKTGKPYATPGWREQDEDGLSIIVSAKIRGDAEIKRHKLDLISAWPRHSGLWATAPRQQIAYLATKQWTRLYTPDALLGVYTTDEAEELVVEGERLDTPSDMSTEIMDAARQTVNHTPEWPQERGGILRDRRMIPWDDRIHSGAKSCTQDGFWRRKRGVSEEYIAQVENELAGPSIEGREPDDDELSEAENIKFSEKWFNRLISEAKSEEEISEIKAILYDKTNDTPLAKEVVDGLDHKIAARQAELNSLKSFEAVERPE